MNPDGIDVYCGYFRVPETTLPHTGFMGGFRVILSAEHFEQPMDQIIQCPELIFETADEALDYAEANARTYLVMLAAFGALPMEKALTVQFSRFSPN